MYIYKMTLMRLHCSPCPFNHSLTNKKHLYDIINNDTKLVTDTSDIYTDFSLG